MRSWLREPLGSASSGTVETPATGRVVLGRKDPSSFVGFQWTGEEPEGLSDIEVAQSIGAVWEGDELVTHNLEFFRHNWRHREDGWLEDSD